jgi:hypothetical protein
MYCVETCIITGSNPRIKSFDQDHLSETELNGNCKYTAMNGGGYSVTFKSFYCGPQAVGCAYMVSF